MLTAASAQRLRTTFGELTVDAFASGATALLARFWSAEAVAGAEGIDAFKQSWAGERLLVHAPVALLADPNPNPKPLTPTLTTILTPTLTPTPTPTLALTLALALAQPQPRRGARGGGWRCSSRNVT